MKPTRKALSLCVAAAVSGGVSSYVLAEAVLDGSTGSTGSFSGNMIIPDTVGRAEGTNLFHSFSDFNINAGESATFIAVPPGADLPPPTFSNVITRVTGDNPSTINGPLNSAIPGADFYFMNPNGVMFKEQAQINVNGAFYATTADFIRLGTGGVFYAELSQDSSFTTAPPSAFGFLGPSSDISLEGTQLLQYFTLNQPTGATLSFVGGDIGIDQAAEGTPTWFGTETSRGSYLSAPGNRIELVSTASAGEAVRTAGGYELDSFSELGQVSISGNSVVAARDVYIRGGNLVVGQGLIAPGFFSLAGMAPPPNGGGVDVAMTGDIDIAGSSPLAITVTNPSYGPISPNRPSGAPFLSGIFTFGGTGQPDAPTADVPDIAIVGSDITMSGIASVASERFGPGEAADVDITGRSVELSNGGVVGNLNFYFGPGGTVTVDADQVVLDGGGAPYFTGINTVSDFHPLFASPPPFPTPFDPSYTYGDSANITVSATGESGLTIRSGAAITTESRAFGRAGDISITASDVNLSRDGAPVGSIASQSGLIGDSGNITIDASGTVTISDGFEVSATTAGTGRGGTVTVSADEAIDISGENSGIFSATVTPPDSVKNYLANRFGTPNFDALLQALGLPPDSSLYDALAALQSMGLIFLFQPPAPGDAGPIVLTSSELGMNGSARIDSSTTDDGEGGAIIATLGSLTMTDGAQIRSRSGGVRRDTGQVDVGTGSGGLVNIAATEDIDISGSDTAVTTSTLGDGDGGDIELQATNVYLSDGGSVSAESTGTEASLGAGAQPGDAGDITITALQDFENIGGSVTTEAVEADGGDIKIAADGTVYLLGGDITTSVLGAGGTGGNIDIDPELVILQGGSNVLANAKNPAATQAGNIYITGDFILISQDSLVEATGPTNDKNGEIIIRGPDGELSRSLAQLPESYLNAAGLLKGGCGAAQAGLSSLVLAGRGGVPAQPTGYVPSFDLAAFGLSGQGAVARANMPNLLVALGPKDPTATGWLLAERGCR